MGHLAKYCTAVGKINTWYAENETRKSQVTPKQEQKSGKETAAMVRAYEDSDVGEEEHPFGDYVTIASVQE